MVVIADPQTSLGPPLSEQWWLQEVFMVEPLPEIFNFLLRFGLLSIVFEQPCDLDTPQTSNPEETKTSILICR